MKTIKIIDLLNKIANGEEVPKKINYLNQDWQYNPTNDYEGLSWGGCLLNNVTLNELTNQVTILNKEDEFKDIEKLNLEQDELVNNKDIRPIDYLFEGTINQLIKNQKKILEKLNKE